MDAALRLGEGWVCASIDLSGEIVTPEANLAAIMGLTLHAQRGPECGGGSFPGCIPEGALGSSGAQAEFCPKCGPHKDST